MVMQAAMDATSVDMQPRLNANRIMCIYFVVFMFVCGIFMMNLVSVCVPRHIILPHDAISPTCTI